MEPSRRSSLFGEVVWENMKRIIQLLWSSNCKHLQISRLIKEKNDFNHISVAQINEVSFNIKGLSSEIMLLFFIPLIASLHLFGICSLDLLEGSADIVMEGYEASSGSIRRDGGRVKHPSLCNFCYSSHLLLLQLLALSSTWRFGLDNTLWVII